MFRVVWLRHFRRGRKTQTLIQQGVTIMAMSVKFSLATLQALACGNLTVQQVLAQSGRLEKAAEKAPRMSMSRVDEMYAQWQGMPDGAEREALRARLLAELSAGKGALPDEKIGKDGTTVMTLPHIGDDADIRPLKQEPMPERMKRIEQPVKIDGKVYGALRRVDSTPPPRYRRLRPAAAPIRPDPQPVLRVFPRQWQRWLSLADNEQGKPVANPPCPEALLYGSPRWALSSLAVRVVYERKRVLCKTTAAAYSRALRQSCRAIGVVKVGSKSGKRIHYLAKIKTVPVEQEATEKRKQATAAVANVLRRFGYEV
jgi:hypothetical protein